MAILFEHPIFRVSWSRSGEQYTEVELLYLEYTITTNVGYTYDRHMTSALYHASMM